MRQHNDGVEPEAGPEALRQDFQRRELPARTHRRVQAVDVHDEVGLVAVVCPEEGARA